MTACQMHYEQVAGETLDELIAMHRTEQATGADALGELRLFLQGAHGLVLADLLAMAVARLAASPEPPLYWGAGRGGNGK